MRKGDYRMVRVAAEGAFEVGARRYGGNTGSGDKVRADAGLACGERFAPVGEARQGSSTVKTGHDASGTV